MQTASHKFIAVKLETTYANIFSNGRNLLYLFVKILTGRFDLNPLDVVKKLSIVVTPNITLAGTAFHSIQNVTKLEVTRMIPEIAIVMSMSHRTMHEAYPV